jgi:hypothetical protein
MAEIKDYDCLKEFYEKYPDAKEHQLIGCGNERCKNCTDW